MRRSLPVSVHRCHSAIFDDASDLFMGFPLSENLWVLGARISHTLSVTCSLILSAGAPLGKHLLLLYS